jgi:conjugal transfer/type IV secretion protein DotA/TraY
MVQVTYQGKVLATAGTALAGAGLGGNIAAAAPGAFKWLPGVAGASEGIKIVSGWAITTGMAFLVAGFIIGTMIPMIPLVYFYSAVLSWILLVVESMFAVPLAVLSLFAPAREGSLIGSWNKILMSILGIFFRPFFTVVGMIFAMMVLAFALKYLYELFYILMEFLVPSQTLWNMLSMIGFVVVYVIVTVSTVLLSAQLITELGDGALNWLGVTFGHLANRLDVGRESVMASSLTGPGMTGRFNPSSIQRAARERIGRMKDAENTSRLKRIPGGGS